MPIFAFGQSGTYVFFLCSFCVITLSLTIQVIIRNCIVIQVFISVFLRMCDVVLEHLPDNLTNKQSTIIK